MSLQCIHRRQCFILREDYQSRQSEPSTHPPKKVIINHVFFHQKSWQKLSTNVLPLEGEQELMHKQVYLHIFFHGDHIIWRPSYQFRNSHYKDRTVLGHGRLIFMMGMSYPGRPSLYWDRAQGKHKRFSQQEYRHQHKLSSQQKCRHQYKISSQQYRHQHKL